MSQQKNKIGNNLYDPVSERLIISAILEHGHIVFYDVDSYIKEELFYLPQNQLIFSILKSLIINDKINKPDITTILGKIQTLDKNLISKYNISDYLFALKQEHISPENLKPFVQRVLKFGLARNFKNTLADSLSILDNITGDESLIDIISQVEKPIQDFTVSLLRDDDIISLGQELVPYLEYLAEEKPPTQGVPTGFNIFDKYLGGGLRMPGVHLVGARSGVGKSFFALNVADYTTNLNIPTLYLDTELTKEITMSRWSSKISNVPIDQIETGQFANNLSVSTRVSNEAKKAKDKPFYYYNISGKHHTEWLSIIRRFLMKIVGFNKNGQTNPCLIILDYLKMMNLNDAQSFQEYQYLGQIITDLHNACIQYTIPMLAMIQLNRDGITKEDQSTASGSDRLVWLCSSYSILKNKTQEDYADDPISNGDKKIIIAKTRFGTGTKDGEYINIITDLSKGIMREGRTNINNRGSKMKLATSEHVKL